MQKLRAGVVGTGFGSAVHMPAYALHPDYELVGVASVRPGRAQDVAQAFGVPAFATWQALLDEGQLDVLSVVTEPLKHHEMAKAALDHGCHVLLEKPMAMNVGEAEDLLRLQQESGKIGLINHEFRTFPARRAVWEWLRQERLGRVLSVMVTMGGRRNYAALAQEPVGWLGKREHGGGMLGATGSHVIDTLLWWFGPIQGISGELVTEVTDRPNGPATAEDGFSALLRFKNGVSGTVVSRSTALSPNGLVIDIHGTAGSLRLIGDESVEFCSSRGREWQAVPLPGWDLPVAAPTGVARLVPNTMVVLSGLATCIREGLDPDRDALPMPLVSFRQGVEVQRVMDAWRFSNASGMRWRP